MKNAQHDLKRLPRSFRKVSFGLLLLTVLFVVLSTTHTLSLDKEISKQITISTLLLSLLLLALTKDKAEDERLQKIRLKAYTASFIYGVTLAIINPLLNLVFDGSFLSDMEVNQLLITMLLFYFIVFQLLKARS
ncbi:MAG: hypothetical protein EP332_09930 [Bacteroidetes bacterium]|nr:MAG: hypothetical protein EP332_09930 [Bacteroidota bacterium]